MSTIITRNSANSGSTPSVLVQGELAINVTDGRLFYGSGSGNVVKEFGVTSSYALQALSSSYAETASYAPAYLPLTGGTINGDVIVNGTASIAFLNVSYESASVIYSSGSNQFGDASNDVQTLYGTVDVKTGPVLVTGSLDVSGGITGSLLGTASYAAQALSSSYALSASHADHATSASYALTASYVNPLNQNVIITGSIYIPDNTYGIYFSGSGPASKLIWNDADGTLDLGLKGGNVTLQIGQEEVVRVVNKTGVNLTEAGYQVVRLDGAQGNRIKVALAKGDGDANSLDTLGLVTEDIAINQEGFVTSYGLVRNIDTRGVLQGETWADGDSLYLSPTVFGGITNIPPTAPSHSVRLGYVVQSSPNGSIFVKVDNGYELDELHNVYINTASLAYGDLLMRDGNNIWTNSKQLSGSYAITGSLTISGSSTFTNIGPAIFSGSVTSTGGFTGSLLGTATTASYVLQAVSASFASTASSVNTLNQIVNVGTIQLDNTTGNISATSFNAGGLAVQIDGPTGTITAYTVNADFTGSLFGTASYATQALSASWAPASNPFPYNGDAQISGSLGVTGSFSTQTFDGLTYVPAISISDFSRTIYDVMGTSSFDADARDLYDSTTVNSISWESRRLSDGLGGASVYWDTRWLVDPLGITTVRWGIRTGYDSSTSQSIDWGGRILYDANESYSIDWAAKALWGTGGFPTLEWASRYLNDASGNISVDWGNRLTKDSSNKESIDYQNRQLKNSNGNEVLNWQSGVTITGSAIVSGSLESTGSFSVQTYNSFLAATATAIELNDTTRRIYDTSGLLSIDALFRTANYQNLSPSIDWQNSFLYDSLGNTAVDWTSRSLLDSSNTVVFNWDAFALNYKIETNTYLKRFIEVGTQDLFSDVGVVGFNYEGEVIEATLDGTVNQFDLVYLETDGKWYPVAQGTADCTKLLGICAETGARPKVILEGSITVNDGTYIDTPIVQGINFGLPIYVRESAGNTMSTVVPTTAGQYVRILGHAYYQNTGSPEYWTMKFRPSNEWIEL